MKLEEAISRIEEMRTYKSLASTSPVSVDCRPILQEISPSLCDLLFHQEAFYSELDRLQEWSSLEPPVAEKYGNKAVKWLKSKKLDHCGTKLLFGGSIAAIGGGIISTLPIWIAGAAAMLSGALIWNHTKFQSEELYREDEVLEFKAELKDFYGFKAYFTRKDLDILGDATARYKECIDRFRWVLRKQGYHESELGILNRESENLSGFESSYKGIIEAISRVQKGPLPHWSRAGAHPSADSMVRLDMKCLSGYMARIGSVHQMMEEYVKGPRLVVIK